MNHLVPLWDEKRLSMQFRGLFISFGLVLNFTNELLSLMSLLASNVFNDSCGVKKLPLIGLIMNMRGAGVYSIKK